MDDSAMVVRDIQYRSTYMISSFYFRKQFENLSLRKFGKSGYSKYYPLDISQAISQRE